MQTTDGKFRFIRADRLLEERQRRVVKAGTDAQ